MGHDVHNIDEFSSQQRNQRETHTLSQHVYTGDRDHRIGSDVGRHIMNLSHAWTVE